MTIIVTDIKGTVYRRRKEDLRCGCHLVIGNTHVICQGHLEVEVNAQGLEMLRCTQCVYSMYISFRETDSPLPIARPRCTPSPPKTVYAKGKPTLSLVHTSPSTSTPQLEKEGLT